MTELEKYTFESKEKLDNLGLEDNGTMPKNVNTLSENIVGRRIVDIGRLDGSGGVALLLDDGRTVELVHSSDCRAYTYTTDLILHLDKIAHAITGVGTTGGYTRWHIYADLGDVLEIGVEWSCGNAFYYGYGFDIFVKEPGVRTRVS